MTASVMEYLTMVAMGRPNMKNTINELEAPTQIHCPIPDTQPASAIFSPTVGILLTILVCMIILLLWQNDGLLQGARQQQEENASLHKTNSELTTSMAELMEKGQKEQEEAAKEVADLKKTDAELKTDTQSLKEEVEDLKKTNSELKTDGQSHEKELESFRRIATNLKECNSELKTKAQNFESERSELELGIATLKKDLVDSEYCLDAHGTLLLGTTMQLETTRAQLAAANYTISDLRQCLTGLEAKDKHDQQPSEVKKINPELVKTAESHEKRVQDLQDSERAETEEDVEILKEELWDIKGQLNTAGALLHDALSELERTRRKRSSARKAFAAAREKVITLPAISGQRPRMVDVKPYAHSMKSSDKKFVDDVALDRIKLQEFRCVLNCKDAELERKDAALKHKDGEIAMLRGQGEGI
ncbi:hypothetical protein AC578_5533 [Pseudocercospora eumusae]|uniref:Uncharacterized protein n=1 Tax=Pseudocercospora eumusae TaxID=321146 RepID=A0A139H3D3_9PEZI|nr:hypothetical protein AC578_5533 [Pseudocercospora eumusae]